MHYLRARVRVRIIWKSISAAKNTQMTRCTSSALIRAGAGRWKRRRAEGRPFASRWIYRGMAADYLRIRWRRSRINFCLDWTCVSTTSKAACGRKRLSQISKDFAGLLLAAHHQTGIDKSREMWLMNLLKLFDCHHIEARDAYFILFKLYACKILYLCLQDDLISYLNRNRLICL